MSLQGLERTLALATEVRGYSYSLVADVLGTYRCDVLSGVLNVIGSVTWLGRSLLVCCLLWSGASMVINQESLCVIIILS